MFRRYVRDIAGGCVVKPDRYCQQDLAGVYDPGLRG